MSESLQIQWTDAWINANDSEIGISDTEYKIFKVSKRRMFKSQQFWKKRKTIYFMDSRAKAG